MGCRGGHMYALIDEVQGAIAAPAPTEDVGEVRVAIGANDVGQHAILDSVSSSWIDIDSSANMLPDSMATDGETWFSAAGPAGNVGLVVRFGLPSASNSTANASTTIDQDYSSSMLGYAPETGPHNMIRHADFKLLQLRFNEVVLIEHVDGDQLSKIYEWDSSSGNFTDPLVVPYPKVVGWCKSKSTSLFFQLDENGNLTTNSPSSLRVLPNTTSAMAKIVDMRCMTEYRLLVLADGSILARDPSVDLPPVLGGVISFDASENHYIYSRNGFVTVVGVSNEYGQLGQITAPAGAGSSLLQGVITSLAQIRVVAALNSTNYAVSQSGNVYVWGLNGKNNLFGYWSHGNAASSSVPVVIPWLSKPSWPSQTSTPYVINKIFALLNTVHFVIGPLNDNYFGGTCIGPPPSGFPPSTVFICQNGAWVTSGTINVGTGTTIVIGGPTVIVGSIDVPPGSTLNLPLPPLGLSSLTIQGCSNISGTVIVTLTEEQLKQIEKQGGSKEATLVSAQCGHIDPSSLTAKSAKKSCRKVSATSTTQDSSSSISLIATFKVDSSACAVWWIVLVSVLGGVMLIIIVIALLATFTPLKNVIRPFLKRNAHASTGKTQ